MTLGMWILVIALIITSVLLAAGIVYGPKVSKSNPDFLRQDDIYRIEDGEFVTYRRNILFQKKRQSSVTLNAVKFISWYVSPFSTKGTIHVQLWSEDPQLVQGFEAYRTNDVAECLGWIRSTDLAHQPNVHSELHNFFAPRLEAGQVTSTVDLETLVPLSAPPREPGWMFTQDGEVLFDPNLAATEREMKDGH